MFIIVSPSPSKCRMSHRISTKNSSCVSLQCSMVLFVKKILKCLVLFPPSTTVLGWRGLKPECDLCLVGFGACALIHTTNQPAGPICNRCCYNVRCLALPSGHWCCSVPVLTCLYNDMKCVYVPVREDLVTVSHSCGPLRGLLDVARALSYQSLYYSIIF